MAAHWGSIFEVDKWYEIKFTESAKLTIITDYDKYMSSLKGVTELIPELASNKIGNIPHELIERQNNVLMEASKFLLKINVDRHVVIGDDKSHQNFLVNRKELLDKYNSDKFNTTVHFFDEYFETINKVREDKINKII